MARIANPARDQRPAPTDGDVLAGVTETGTRIHAAEFVVDWPQTEQWRVNAWEKEKGAVLYNLKTLCARYRTPEGDKLSRPAPEMARFLREPAGEMQEGLSPNSWNSGGPLSFGDVITQLGDDKKWQGMSVCTHCRRVYEHGGDGQPSLSAADQKVVDAASKDPVKLAKGLNRDQRNALNRVIANDFKQLRANIDLQHAEWVRTESARIEDEFSDQELRLQEAKDLSAKFESEVRSMNATLEGKLRAQGIIWSPTTVVRGPSNFKVAGKDSAIADMKEKARLTRDTAVRLCETKRLAAERQILLSAVTAPDALEFLDTVPSAAEVFSEAMEARKEIEA